MAEVNRLRSRLSEVEESLGAIQRGEIDALLVAGPKGDQIFTLQGAEHPYRVLVEAISEGAATLLPDGTILYSNQRFAAMLGVPLEKLIGTVFFDLFSETARAGVEELLQRARSSPVREEVELPQGGNAFLTAQLSVSAFSDSGTETLCVVATDLSQRRRTEEHLRRLSAKLLNAQDQERRRLARELHDSEGQNLSVLLMLLSKLQRTCEAFDADSQTLLTESIRMADQSLRNIRTLSYLLHPPLLDEFGLISALRWYVEGFSERSGIKVTLDVPPALNRLPREVETSIFRLVQEGLTNVHRHSGSETARIALDHQDGELRLQIEDQGKGLDVAALAGVDGRSNSGVGIAGMKERVRELGGAFRIESCGHNTCIKVTLPLLPLANAHSA